MDKTPYDDAKNFMFCGEDWSAASASCKDGGSPRWCPGGTDEECPDASVCWADTACNMNEFTLAPTERPTNRQRSIELKLVKGKRLKKGVNKQEADALLTTLKSIISEQRQLPEAEVHTLGVLSFFSAQASYLEKMVFDQISLNQLR